MTFEMDLDQCLLEEFKNFHYELYYSVIQLLNKDDKWRNIISALSQYRVPMVIPAYKIKKMEMSQSPGAELFNELIMRTCTVFHFKELLKIGELTDILSLISEDENLEITLQPGDDEQVLYVCYNDELHLECQAVGLPPPKYQWFVDNTPLENQTNPVLRIPNFSLDNEGDYYCVVSQHLKADGLFEVESHTVTACLMDVLPEFVQQPPLKIVRKSGSNLQLTVEISCPSRYSLQWLFGNVVLPGEIDTTLTLENLTRRNSGLYRCMASNNAGDVYTIPSELKVEAEPVPTAKVALLIANEKYVNFDKLSTPINDVILLNEKLTQLKFRVITLINLNRVEMENTIKWFFQLTPPGSYAIICFVGHGFMFNSKYMMPIDCPTKYRAQDCFSEDLLVKYAKETKLRFLLLMMDMCLAVPKREDNPLIFDEIAPDYSYTFNGDCHVVKTFPTTNHQKSYEDPNWENGFYLKHICRYLTLDKSIAEILIKAHDDFERKKLIKLQKPSVNFEGGYLIKLTDFARETDDFLAKYESVNKLIHIHELNFSQIGFKTNLYVAPYKKKILNAIDLHFLPVLKQWDLLLDLAPPKGFEIISQHFDDGRVIITMFNVQKANSDISLNIILKDPSSQNIIASAAVDLGMPLFTTAKIWCENSSVEDG